MLRFATQLSLETKVLLRVKQMFQFLFIRITVVCFQNGPFYTELQNITDYY